MSFDFKNDPFENFLKLFNEAQQKGVPEAQAMALATVNNDIQPSVRIVYFKGFFGEGQNRGFCFFTNYDGRKGHDLSQNPKAAANFFWPHLDQQVRIEGVVRKLPRENSEKYFATRPRLSQIGAWASHQSEKIESYEQLAERIELEGARFQGKAVPCPPHWGGYELVPSEIEFWFGKVGRLHERYVYHKKNNDWEKFLRSP